MHKKDRLSALKKAWFGKITTKEEAVKAVKEASSGFYAIAGLNIIIGIFLWRFYIVEGAIYLTISTILRLLKSRGAAITLFLVSVVAVISTVSNFLNRAGNGGRNIFLALIVLGASIRAIQAAYKFHSLSECAADSKKLGKSMLIWGGNSYSFQYFRFFIRINSPLPDNERRRFRKPVF